MVRRSRNLCLILCSGTSIGWQSISASRRSEDAIHWRSFDIEIFCVYPHAYAWRFRVDTEPPCVSMRVDASIAANWNRRDSLLAQAPRLTHGAMLSTNHVVKALV